MAVKVGVCRYAQRSEYAVRVSESGLQTPSDGPMLCGWALDAAPANLIDTPRWLQRNALAGHLIKYPDDCHGCPVFSARQDYPEK